jgi:membrane-associated phospholipid phosphatase
MSVTALIAGYLFDVGRRLKLGLWIWLGITTVATVYLGWHYFIDDVAGVLVAVAALYAARVITGYDPRVERSERTAGDTSVAAPATP